MFLPFISRYEAKKSKVFIMHKKFNSSQIVSTFKLLSQTYLLKRRFNNLNFSSYFESFSWSSSFRHSLSIESTELSSSPF